MASDHANIMDAKLLTVNQSSSDVSLTNVSGRVTIKFTPDGIPITDFSNDPSKLAMDTAIKWLSIGILIEVMLGMGCTVDIHTLKDHIRRPIGVGIAAFTQFVVMPLLVFGIASAAQIHTVAAVTILITASVPGGSLSNILTYLIEGDIALSMLMTACSSVLAFAFIPFNLFVYGSHWLPADTDYANLIPYSSVILSVILMMLPVAMGVGINWKWPNLAKHIVTACKILLAITIVVLAILSGLLYEDTLLRYMPKEMWIFCVFMPLVGYGLGFLFASCARLDSIHRRTVAIESGCQNGQLGCAILKVAFPNQLIGSFFIFPLLYSVFQLSEGLILVAFFRYRNRRRDDDNDGKDDLAFLSNGAMYRIRTVSLHVIDKMREKAKLSGLSGDCEKPVIPEDTTDISNETKEDFSSTDPEISEEFSSVQSGTVNPAFQLDSTETS